MSHPEQTLESLKSLAALEELDIAILFGSLAVGRGNPDSDLDIAVYPNHPFSPSDLNALSDRIALICGRPVDLVDLSRANGTLLRQILKKGKIIFSKKPGTLGILAERLLDWQEDFEPAYQSMLANRRNRFLSPSHG